MSWVDVLVVLLAIVAGISGWRHGMAVALLSFVGVLGGAILGVQLAPLLAAFVAWKTIYTNLMDEFGGKQPKADWSPVEHEMLDVIGIEKLLAVERATVEKGKP